jgi:hypothetical protein
VKVGIDRNELSEGSSEDFLEVESDENNYDEEGDENGSLEHQTGLKWEFRDATWKNPNFIYERTYASRIFGKPKKTFYFLPHVANLYPFV